MGYGSCAPRCSYHYTMNHRGCIDALIRHGLNESFVDNYSRGALVGVCINIVKPLFSTTETYSKSLKK